MSHPSHVSIFKTLTFNSRSVLQQNVVLCSLKLHRFMHTGVLFGDQQVNVSYRQTVIPFENGDMQLLGHAREL